MAMETKVGMVQMTSGPDMGLNVSDCCSYIDEAVALGASFVLTPEMTNIFERSSKRLLDVCFAEDEDPHLKTFQASAKKHGIWLLIGSMAILSGAGKLNNRSYLISPKGEIVARYDKLHMFDANLPNGERYEESKSYIAGKEAVLVKLPFANVGLSICYDLRFPVLYQQLALAGANVLVVPSAFTKTTGQAHWHTLLKARAIETGCYVLAPAQTGLHAVGRETYGHSLIVDPWGNTVCDGKMDKGVLTASLNLVMVDEARAKIPSLKAAKKQFSVNVIRLD
jgi:predicted amidohydrolase